jgi:hypothetical protein
MKPFFSGRGGSEKGSALIIVLMLLLLLTIGGLAATTSTNIELQISGNEKFHKMAFYAAEAGKSYAAKTPELYGSLNITSGSGPHFFPNETEPYAPKTIDDFEKYALSPTQAFRGEVQYLGSSVPPRGSGTQVGRFVAHKYRMTCYGYGPSNAESQIEVGFYRLGF